MGTIFVHGFKANRHSQSVIAEVPCHSLRKSADAFERGVGIRCWERAGGVMATGAEARMGPQ
jgi:hypothetical protein